ncbi:MAG: SDR family NAD(P)-dependent oxidoreductase, partial [Alphaproteobacteria bacterium]|nr:SDR family NAD(P)-dependent oxidoreductase [Alphaproteobacteria bacterium]
MAIRFDGRVAIVTGAGHGLGKSYALALGARGAKVVVNDIGGAIDGSGTSATPADAVVEEIKAAGGEAIANYDSVAERDSAANIVQTAIDTYGSSDIIINNAGIVRDKSFHKMTL